MGMNNPCPASLLLITRDMSPKKYLGRSSRRTWETVHWALSGGLLLSFPRRSPIADAQRSDLEVIGICDGMIHRARRHGNRPSPNQNPKGLAILCRGDGSSVPRCDLTKTRSSPENDLHAHVTIKAVYVLLGGRCMCHPNRVNLPASRPLKATEISHTT